MWIQQIAFALMCILFTQQIAAVVNTNQNVATDNESNTNLKSGETSSASSSTNVVDSLAASSEKESNRREAPLSDAYGPPIPIKGHEVYGPPVNSYVPNEISNPGLPVPVYGIPDGPTNNIVYPAPPPDIPPAINTVQTIYGPPKETYGPPKEQYGPPKEQYGPPKEIYGPPPPTKYGPPPGSFPKPPKLFNPIQFNKPKQQYGPPPRPHYGPPHHKPHFKPVKPEYGLPPKPQYGPPKPHYGPPPKVHYGPPIKHHGPPPSPPTIYGPPKDQYGPPKEQYGPPKEQYGPPKEQYGPPPKDIYGPPKDIYGPPKDIYGPPKDIYGPPPKEHYGPPPHKEYGPPKEIYGPPKEVYGPPKDLYGPPPKLHGPPKDIFNPPTSHYGPPEPIPHGPPHPGVPAPPTPPDIKYDGWQPIPGLVSRPPSGSYGAPHDIQNGVGDIAFNNQFVPSAVPGHGISSLSLGSSYGSSAGISDSYGAPLNTVTGSGGVISTSGDAHIHNQDQSAISLGLSAAGIGSSQEGHLSLIKSIGYEIFPHGNGGGNGGASFSAGGPTGFTDTYSAPPLNSYSPNGPYAASHSYKNHGVASSFVSSFGPFNSNVKGLSLSSSGIGLIPPSGVYGVPPSGQYGTPLLNGPHHNNLDFAPPKNPVIFREPVPHGLIQSIGNHVQQKDAAGIIESSHANFNGPSYIPPPVPDLSIVHKDELKPPSTLYSLPRDNSPISFHGGSSSAHLSSGAHTAALTSYSAPLNTIDNSYGAPHSNGQIQGGGVTVSIDHSLPPATIDLTHYGAPSYSGGIPHDCSAHKAQPLPQLNYGAPTATSYTSIKTSNIGIGQQYPSITPDLQTAHSQTNGASTNVIVDDNSKDQYGKSLAESFAPGGELIKSQSIDFNNIPVQGALGTYTLQIQPAGGINDNGAAAPGQVPHDQVLNDGLLQSILAAIEQPQQKDAQILGQPLLQLSPNQPQNYPQIHDNFQLPLPDSPARFSSSDDEGQQSIKTQVVIVPPTTDKKDESNTETQTVVVEESSKPAAVAAAAEGESPLQLIENNEIALYFHNNSEETQQKKETNDLTVKNGQQYGSYVSFKTPNASYVYGDLKSETPTEQT